MMPSAGASAKLLNWATSSTAAPAWRSMATASSSPRRCSGRRISPYGPFHETCHASVSSFHPTERALAASELGRRVASAWPPAQPCATRFRFASQSRSSKSRAGGSGCRSACRSCVGERSRGREPECCDRAQVDRAIASLRWASTNALRAENEPGRANQPHLLRVCDRCCSVAAGRVGARLLLLGPEVSEEQSQPPAAAV